VAQKKVIRTYEKLKEAHTNVKKVTDWLNLGGTGLGYRVVNVGSLSAKISVD
jgi:hypothetical protein